MSEICICGSQRGPYESELGISPSMALIRLRAELVATCCYILSRPSCSLLLFVGACHDVSLVETCKRDDEL